MSDLDSPPIKWSGEHRFLITGIGIDDDTIRIEGDQRKTEKSLTLILPTLSITYADMKFANQIGGIQKKFPDSKDYGAQFFDPPVVLTGAKEIEKFTLIRGAKRVTIGREEVKVEFESWRTLVIPQLQIKKKEKMQAVVHVPEISITVTQPFNSNIMQFADGRHVGGVKFTKAHPDWKPKPIPERYDLWVRVIEGEKRRALAEVKVTLLGWDEDKGDFVQEGEWYTNKMGVVNAPNLPVSDKKLLNIERAPFLAQSWRFRPLPGQKVKRTFLLWQKKEVTFPFIWKVGDSIDVIAGITGKPVAAILKINGVKSATEFKDGQTVKIPALEAVYRVTARDTLRKLAVRFCYRNVEELARLNKLTKPYKLYRNQALRLPGWCFFIARSGDRFSQLDKQFKLRRGWVRPARLLHHDIPNRVFKNEVLAIPTPEFIRSHRMRKRRRNIAVHLGRVPVRPPKEVAKPKEVVKPKEGAAKPGTRIRNIDVDLKRDTAKPSTRIRKIDVDLGKGTVKPGTRIRNIEVDLEKDESSSGTRIRKIKVDLKEDKD